MNDLPIKGLCFSFNHYGGRQMKEEVYVAYNERYEGFCDSCKYFIPSVENPRCTRSGEELLTTQLWRVCISWDEKE